MTRFALSIEFDGRPFSGWQRQNGQSSVQQSLEEALFRITGDEVQVHGAGRTDAGVHARSMRAHCDVERPITPFRLMEAMNAHLRPNPVAVLTCEVVPDDWHARFSCIGRRYLYRIVTRRAPLTFDKGLAWRIPKELNVEAMHQAAQHLVGLHDFTTFRSAHCQSASPVKTLDRLDVERVGDEVHIHTAARSFLHHQVRSMTGCLSLVGEGKWSADDLQAALDAHDRAALGYNAPPDGLYFMEAVYPA